MVPLRLPLFCVSKESNSVPLPPLLPSHRALAGENYSGAPLHIVGSISRRTLSDSGGRGSEMTCGAGPPLTGFERDLTQDERKGGEVYDAGQPGIFSDLSERWLDLLLPSGGREVSHVCNCSCFITSSLTAASDGDNSATGAGLHTEQCLSSKR